ncbi:Eco57I restriction-modification methylase domain-containing protein [Nostoc sp.]|uniref:Eco57I restriction-modification methylase domain-containing protein n=1 Tax=Nostoc sp. TaxID=1180 RepID=UPI003FA5DF0B
MINGKRHGKDVNFYKLFLEQCFNLLRHGGGCGIVIPSGIYTDLGANKLRKMLFIATARLVRTLNSEHTPLPLAR